MAKELKRILCVDDEEDILSVIKMCLETLANFDVYCCSSGKEVLAKVATINPDLILSDVMMPEMDGPATLKKLREVPELNDIPLVFMTARVQPEDVAGYLALGAAAVIKKPFDPMSITQEIADIWANLHGE